MTLVGEVPRDVIRWQILTDQAVVPMSVERNGDRFDLVVLDETMPGLTGSQVVEELRPKWPNLRVLRTSGFSKMPVPTQPATAFLAKPYSSVALARAVDELMSRALN